MSYNPGIAGEFKRGPVAVVDGRPVNPDRIRASCQAADVSFSREQWYRLYVAGRGGRSMP